MIDHYDWSGGREAMLRFGPETGPVVVVALPLFEEANRMRAFAVTLCRALAKRGVASVLPDLPGQGESLVALTDLSLIDLEQAYEALVEILSQQGHRCYALAIRSGALLDGLTAMCGHWHFAPQDGPDLLRTLTRIKQASGGTQAPIGDYWYYDPPAPDGSLQTQTEVAGNLVSTAFLSVLKATFPLRAGELENGGALRIVRLDTDPKPAGRHVPGALLWRRSEPDNDPALAVLLADDIADWIAACEGC